MHGLVIDACRVTNLSTSTVPSDVVNKQEGKHGDKCNEEVMDDVMVENLLEDMQDMAISSS